MTTLYQLQTVAEHMSKFVFQERFPTHRELSIYRVVCLHQAGEEYGKHGMTNRQETFDNLSGHMFVEDTTDEELETCCATLKNIETYIWKNGETDTLVPAAL
ncbi:hypothetical protein [Synechococcus sp. MIT S9504]|uniref:hypothetical protein n=1 Tax=Synechococcus sp. MIT S9504 TaxID=1801628 RepID=UPI0012E8B24A|nr:hypothetical protein [Synechococcus sp. MIT S9504]